MKRRTALSAAAILLSLSFLPACGGEPSIENIPRSERPTPVSGVTNTKSGVSIDFPEGWAEYPTSGRPYTTFYENKKRQLAMGLTEFSNQQTADALGDQVKRRLQTEGTLVEFGPVTIDGAPAYRVVASLKTVSGNGLVIGTAIARKNDRGTAIYLYSSGDEKEDHRAEMDALLATIRMK